MPRRSPRSRSPLLVPVIRGGRQLAVADAAGEVRAARGRFDADLAWLPEPARRLADPTPLTAAVSPALAALHERVVAQVARGGTY